MRPYDIPRSENVGEQSKEKPNEGMEPPYPDDGFEETLTLSPTTYYETGFRESHSMQSHCSWSEEYDEYKDRGKLMLEGGSDVCEEKEENHPIEIVAATVPTTDDPTLPCLTFRFWILATLFTIVGAASAQISYFRANSLMFSVFFVQLISYPLGHLMAVYLPKQRYRIWTCGFSLNPGPFNKKEHLLVGVAAATGGTAAYAVDIIAVRKLFYGHNMGFVSSMLLLVSSQCIGYGLAGFLRSLLVTPSSMVWPSNLVQVALYSTLHSKDSPNGQKVAKLRFFSVTLVVVCLYQILPSYMMPLLSSISILCYVAPQNQTLAQLGSGHRGLGLLSLSFDWQAIGSFGPLYTPWWAQVNFYAGTALMLWVVTPLAYYSNLWGSRRYPIISTQTYDVHGLPYNLTRVLDPKTQTLNLTAYNEYSPLRMSAQFALTYGTTFMALTAALMHMFLYYRHNIMDQLKKSRGPMDVHTRLMQAYPQIPTWWYMAILGITVSCAVAVCEVYSLGLPWWALLIAVLLAGSLALPVGIIQAVSNNQIGLNVLSELVGGYLAPGNPIANVTFKVYGYMTMYQCLLFVSDMKLGHYMKIPPKKLFLVQMYGTVLGALVNYMAASFVLHRFYDVLRHDSDPTGQWSARSVYIFYSASIIWGALGPNLSFGGDSPYHPVLWFFLIGLLLPVPFYLLHRRFPNGKWRLVNIPILAIGSYTVPQSPANFLLTAFIAGFISQFFLYRYRHSWWRRYNYILSAALDAGTQISLMFVTFVLSYFVFPTWWGNAVDQKGGAEGCVFPTSSVH